MSWFDIIKAERPTLDELSDQPVAIQDLLDRELPEYLDQQNVWEKQVRGDNPNISPKAFARTLDFSYGVKVNAS